MLSKTPKNNLITGNCYYDFPELYDLLYKRYLKSIPQFVSLVAKHTTKEGKVLDLAAGTGEVSVPLLGKGYKVTSLDLSSGMLEILQNKAKKSKLRKKLKTEQRDIVNFNMETKFDTLCIRQAINYVPNKRQLVVFFKNARKHLKDGGVLVFNAPNFDTGTTGFPTKPFLYEEGKINVFVVESNKLNKRKLVHNQDAVVWGEGLKEPLHYIDQNTFYMYTKEEFKNAMEKAGFTKIDFYSSGLKKYNKKDATLYCVAKK